MSATDIKHILLLLLSINLTSSSENRRNNNLNWHFSGNPRNNETTNVVYRKPVLSTKVISQTFMKAVLPCIVHDGNATITWYKQIGENDSLLLTVNTTTKSWDKRFYAANQIIYNSDQVTIKEYDWTLNIFYAKESDEGLYECRTTGSNNTKNSVFIELKLEEALAEIFGGSYKKVKAGAPLRLSCVLRNALNPPAYIFWFHMDHLINYDLQGGASIRHGRLGSELIIPRVKPEHAGNYSCVPSNARQINVIVEVEHGLMTDQIGED